MAYHYFEGRVGLQDVRGNRGTKIVPIRVDGDTYINNDEQYAAAVGRLQEFTQTFDNIIDAEIVSLTITVDVPTVGLSLKSSPGTREISSGANLTLLTVDYEAVEHERTYWLPSAVDGVFLADLETVDTGDTALLAWIAEFNDTTDEEITHSDKEKVLSIVRGYWASKRRSSNS